MLSFNFQQLLATLMSLKHQICFFSKMYGQLCHRLAHLKVQMAEKAPAPSSTVTFRRLLLNRCQKEFDVERSDDVVMLTAAIIFSCTFQLLKKQDEVSLQQLCTLLTTVGKELNTNGAKPKMDQMFNQITKLIEELSKTACPKPDSVLQSAPLSQLSTPPTRPRHVSAGKKTDMKHRHSETSE
uniref:MIF4G domain-containing protein n=1 Tax=Salarias fasciatus TaxID=181472 RepID=A0A672J589_SALFA